MKKELLENFLKTIAPMVSMGLELGLTYKDFDAVIKQVFVNQAEKIIKDEGNKPTNAAISIVSGLSRTYVTQATKHKVNHEWISTPSRILAARIAQGLGVVIPYNSKDDTPDFVSLAKDVTLDKAPKTILNEMVRLGQVIVNGNEVTFSSVGVNESQVTDKKTLLRDFTDNLEAHALAGVSDLTSDLGAIFLEQAVRVDGIHKDSAKHLSKFSINAWKETYQKIINEAQPISDKEEKQGGKHKLTFGAYCYYE